MASGVELPRNLRSVIDVTPRERAMAYADPLIHALLAAAVALPLVPAAGRGPLVTAVAAGTLIDVDHPIAARSLRLGHNLSLAVRPRTHSLLVALGTGAVGAAAGGPLHGWAAFAGLTAHLLHDAGDDAAPTPLLWPAAAPRQLGRRRALAGMALLAAGSALVSRAAGAGRVRAAAAGADGGGAAAPPRTT